jgi:hypothetical protein
MSNTTQSHTQPQTKTNLIKPTNVEQSPPKQHSPLDEKQTTLPLTKTPTPTKTTTPTLPETSPLPEHVTTAFCKTKVERKKEIQEKINKRRELFRVPLGKSKKILKKNASRISKTANIQNSVLIEILIDQIIEDMIENEKQMKKEREDFNLKNNPDFKKKEDDKELQENENLTFKSLSSLKDKDFITSKILKMVDFEKAAGRLESSLMVDRKRLIHLHKMENKRRRRKEDKKNSL